MSTALTENAESAIIVQGFRGNAEYNTTPHVFVGRLPDGGAGPIHMEFTLTPEGAHILSEELRKHAEFAINNQEEN